MAIIKSDGKREILVVPITHTPPSDPLDGIEIPSAVKAHLGLDFERSWIVITETNAFIWPGPDLRPVPNSDVSTIAYGVLPPRFFAHVRDRFFDRIQKTKRIVKRTD
ncbi:MAG TPA: hypothetical protein VK779_12775 [Rhizomicrobium sp.]|nr:hypothetical protein [Rhizomicrobium sp.]